MLSLPQLGSTIKFDNYFYSCSLIERSMMIRYRRFKRGTSFSYGIQSFLEGREFSIHCIFGRRLRKGIDNEMAWADLSSRARHSVGCLYCIRCRNHGFHEW